MSKRQQYIVKQNNKNKSNNKVRKMKTNNTTVTKVYILNDMDIDKYSICIARHLCNNNNNYCTMIE